MFFLYSTTSSRRLLQDISEIPLRPHYSRPDHSATEQPPPANPTTCSGMDRQKLESCIRSQVKEDLCKHYNIC
ncbi:hypothetical protein K7X08_006676 [Anisodus acutangulus]|uniref:Uncharacterized protein n=1 Tax=Anisodus acutangulus TaxID=402998 RepID=A0A9Q1MVT2_9SOLA|nr:hypothetical protein K7X08_006676 [Anisodus acutangulus]